MPAGKHFHIRAYPRAGDASLELERKEAIVG
jgi:hypothetical protein